MKAEKKVKAESTRHEPRCEKMTPYEHRTLLNYLNEAVRPRDLTHGKPVSVHVHPKDLPADHQAHHEEHDHEEKLFMKPKVAASIIAFRDDKFPLGFRSWRELLEIRDFRPIDLDAILEWFRARWRGRWDDFPHPIPRRGNGSMDGIVHAALLKTGEVLFITADQTTLLWDPENNTPAAYIDPANQPHLMPSGYSQICGHHVQLSDPAGSFMSVGGGGYGPNAAAKAAYILDPATRTWRRSANDMTADKWYPTAVALGGKKVLIASGKTNDPDMMIFDETTETFHPLSGDDKTFPNLYPGLHILPNNAIFYSGTGFGTAGAGPGGVAYNDTTTQPNRLGGKRRAYFTFNGSHTGGTWQTITPSVVNRVKGMSVTLLKSSPPYVRVMTLGGVDPLTNNTYEMFDASILSPTAAVSAPQPVPDGENRTLPSGVLLPDGQLFVCGGIQRTNSPCTLFNPEDDSWARMADLPSIRDYHSAAILLPSGKVMMAGWHNPTIEIYSPPYLFRGARPQISNAPTIVHHGAAFSIESPQADDIVKVTMVRPMAITHQTDSEQRVIELLPCVRDHHSSNEIHLRAPDGGHPHPMAPRGHYMLFAINRNGVPSVAKWVYLH